MIMPAGRSRNLPGPLEQAAAAYRGSAGQLPPVTSAVLAGRASRFAAGVRLGLDQPQALRRLHEVTGGLRAAASSLDTFLPGFLDGALALTGADFGTVQLRDPAAGSLRIVTQSGFDPGFLEYFAQVDDDHSACGRAAREGVQVVITDVVADPGFAPHREMAAASGFRAVQSTPLTDSAGRLVGMVSTHFRHPHRPPGLDLRVMELFADFAGQVIAGLLDVAGEAGRGDPVGRAMISALLEPGDARVEQAITRPGPGAGRGSRWRGPLREVPAEDTVPEFAGYVVNRLFSVGLSLESARSVVGAGPAGDRIAAATGEVDRTIRDIRTAMFGGAAEPAARLTERAARTARALQSAALDAAALLEQEAELARHIGQADYRVEVERWRAFAEQAAQMARRWEQRA